MRDYDEPWLPQLIDIATWATDEKNPYWKNFGWDSLVVPDRDTHVKARMEVLGERFLHRYAYRMLNSETMEQWQVRLQNRFDEVVDKYERAYTLYERYADDIMADVLAGQRIETKGTTKDGGSDKSTDGGSDTSVRKGKVTDTPDSAINESDDFAGTTSKDDSTTSYGRTNVRDYGRTTDLTSLVVTTVTGGVVMDNLNATIDGYRDIDTLFVEEFENNFLNIFWY